MVLYWVYVCSCSCGTVLMLHASQHCSMLAVVCCLLNLIWGIGCTSTLLLWFMAARPCQVRMAGPCGKGLRSRALLQLQIIP